MKNVLSSKLPLRTTVPKACWGQCGTHTSGLAMRRGSWAFCRPAPVNHSLRNAWGRLWKNVNSPPLLTYYWVGRVGSGSQREWSGKGILVLVVGSQSAYMTKMWAEGIRTDLNSFCCSHSVLAWWMVTSHSDNSELTTGCHIENICLPWPCWSDRRHKNRGGVHCVKSRPGTPFSSFKSKLPQQEI